MKTVSIYFLFISLFILSAGCQKKEDSSFNPFLDNQKSSQENEAFFSLYGTRYIHSDLPDEIAFTEYNLKKISYEDFKSNALSFVAKYNYYKKNNNVDINQLPLFQDFYLNFVSDNEVNDYIKTNNLVPSDFTKIKIELLSGRIDKFLSTEISEITKKNELKFYLTPPKAPLERFKLENYPSLGNPLATNQIVIIGMLNCNDCTNLLTQAQELVNSSGLKFKLNYIPHVFNLTDVSNYFIEAAFCAQAVDSKYFWTIIDNMLKNENFLKIKYDDMKGAWDIINESVEYVDINYDDFLKCVSDKVKIKSTVQQSVKKISVLHLTNSPEVFINGVAFKFNGNLAQSLDQVKEFIR